MYEPLWSDAILDEVERNLVSKFEQSAAKAGRRVGHMRGAFPFSAVEGYSGLMPAMTNDPKDRHVLAVAVRAGAALIVTANSKDFPASALSEYGIEAIHPDDFLRDLLDLDPDRTVKCLAEQRAAYTRPALSFNEFYRSLKVTVPAFADEAAAAEAARFDPESPLPLEIVPGDDAMRAFFPDGEPTPEAPLGAAFLWWKALLDIDRYEAALENLSANPDDWGDYRAIFAMLNGWAMMQYVDYCADAPDLIAYVKFMPDPGHAMRAFGPAPLPHVKVLTLVQCRDGLWRAWGLSENHYPTAERVLRSTP